MLKLMLKLLILLYLLWNVDSWLKPPTPVKPFKVPVYRVLSNALKGSLTRRSSMTSNNIECRAASAAPLTPDEVEELRIRVANFTVNTLFDVKRCPILPINKIKPLMDPSKEKHPYIQNVLELEDLVVDTLHKDYEAKGRPVCAVVAGMGKGKTRLLHEMMSDFNNGTNNNNTLAIAVTFNADSKPGQEEECNVFGSAKTYEAMFGVATRMVSMVTGIDFKTSVMEMKNVLKVAANRYCLDFDSLCSEEFGAELLRNLVSHIVEHYNRPKFGETRKNITRFILMVDETRKAIDEYPYAKNLQHWLSGALTPSKKGEDSPVKGIRVCIVLSALDRDATGVTVSARGITTLPLPKEIDPARVVREWIPVYASKWLDIMNSTDVQDRQAVHKMELLISCYAQLPRLVEFVVDELKKFDQLGISPRDVLQPREIFRIVNKVADSIRTTDKYEAMFAYHHSQLATVADALFFHEETILYNDVQVLLRDSVLTNIVTVRDNKNLKICPESAPIILYALAHRNPFLTPVKRLVEGLWCLIDNVNFCIPKKKPLHLNMDTALEMVLQEMVNAHLLAREQRAMNSMNKVSFSLQDLFHVNTATISDTAEFTRANKVLKKLGNVELSDEVFVQLLNDTKRQPSLNKKAHDLVLSQYPAELSLENRTAIGKELWRLDSEWEEIHCLPDSHDHRTSPCSVNDTFLEQAAEVTLENDMVVREVALHPRECADGLWLMRNTEGRVFAVFVEGKAQRIHMGGKVTSREVDEEALNQPKHLLAVANRAAELLRKNSSLYPAGSLAEALAEGRYVRVTLASHQHLQIAVGGNLEERTAVAYPDMNSVMLSGRVVEAFVGPCAPILRTARRLTDTKQDMEEQGMNSNQGTVQ